MRASPTPPCGGSSRRSSALRDGEEGGPHSKPPGRRHPAGRRKVEARGGRQGSERGGARRAPAEAPERWRLFFDFLSQTGLRIGEAIELRWSDLDLGRRRLKVSRACYQGRVEPPKSAYGIRSIPRSEGLARQLWEWRKTNPAAGDGDLVFTSGTATRLRPAT